MRNPKPPTPLRRSSWLRLLEGWEWGYDPDNRPSASLFTHEYDVIVSVRGGSVTIGGSPGAVAPWEISRCVMKEVLLTRGLKALVDDEDFDEISKYRWRAVWGRSSFYADANRMWMVEGWFTTCTAA